MRTLRRVSFLSILLALTLGPNASPGQEPAAQPALAGKIDLDPLRRFLPPADLYMPVPGGMAAVGDPAAATGTFEEQKARRNGGFLIGYCLKLSCNRVTHLAVLQICDNRIGGLTGQQELILGVVKLPYGDAPGNLKALQGRDYALNYSRNGPVEQILTGEISESASANFAVVAEGMGPVAAVEYQGVSVKALQSSDTITMQLVNVRDRISGAQFPRFEIRHLCEQHFS